MLKLIEFNIKNTPIVFDDGGFIYSNPDNTGFKIDFNVYERILLLAKENNIKIPVACCASFFDIDNISNLNNVNPDCDKIINFFKKNDSYIELWNHGLNHMYNDEYNEFYSYNSGNVDFNLQRKKIYLSQKIFHKINFFPKIFVPPAHAWQQDITDKIAKNFGLETIAIREFEKEHFNNWIKNPIKPFKKQWKKSNYLNTLFRLGLGIAYDKTSFCENSKKRMIDYIDNNFPKSILINRKIKLRYPINHFFAHIQNLQDPQSFDYFNFIIKRIMNYKIS